MSLRGGKDINQDMSHRVIGHCFNNLWNHTSLEGASDTMDMKEWEKVYWYKSESSHCKFFYVVIIALIIFICINNIKCNWI